MGQQHVLVARVESDKITDAPSPLSRSVSWRAVIEMPRASRISLMLRSAAPSNATRSTSGASVIVSSKSDCSTNTQPGGTGALVAVVPASIIIAVMPRPPKRQYLAIVAAPIVAASLCLLAVTAYLRILATTPAPTVLPPSRIAKRSP